MSKDLGDDLLSLYLGTEIDGHYLISMRSDDLVLITNYLVKRINDDPSFLTEELKINLKKMIPLYLLFKKMS